MRHELAKYALALLVLAGLATWLWHGFVIAPTPMQVPDPPDASASTPASVSSLPPEGEGRPEAGKQQGVPAIAPATDAALRVSDAGTLALLVPVQGKTGADLVDTFTDARSQGRSHDAIDIMAAAGTPVLAVADGRVEKLFTSERGGLTLYQFEPSGRLAYYYAHLQAYAPGIVEGKALRRGEVIGYVGSTGNASPDAPHLHFAIFELGPERKWWEGDAINPYPLLRANADDAR